MATISKTVNSSNLSSLEFNDDDPKNTVMTVTFKSGGVYEYYKVPMEIFNAIVEEKLTNQKGEPSSGATFIRLVKNQNYKYVKVK